MARGWLRIIAAFVITFDLITIILYQTRDGGQFEEEDDGDEVHRHLLEVGTSELSRFHNETFGTVMRRRQQQLLRLGLDPNPPLVVYNRVPKCGSTTTLDIIRFLKRKLKFHVYNDIAPKMKHYVESDAEELGTVYNSLLISLSKKECLCCEILMIGPRETQPNIPFSSNAFFVLTRAKSRAKAPFAQKALLEKGMFGSGSRGISKIGVQLFRPFPESRYGDITLLTGI